VKNAIKRKHPIPCSLTYEQFLKFTNEKSCHYCGSELIWTERNSSKGTGRSNLDRKDNSAGYDFENLVAACIICNRIKGFYLTYEEMVSLKPFLRRVIPPKHNNPTLKWPAGGPKRNL